MEIIFADDGSADESWKAIKALAARTRGSEDGFARNCGETAASDAALRPGRGTYLMTMDADLQNDPARYPVISGGAGPGSGLRVRLRVATLRPQGDNFIRVASSRIANWVRNRLSDENISDAGCTYRAFDGSVYLRSNSTVVSIDLFRRC